VVASVNGEDLFFESDEAKLDVAPEAFASALLPDAVDAGVRLVSEAPLDPVWMGNTARVLRVWNGWWGTPAQAEAVLVAAPDGRDHAPPPRADVALCFTLGVDSFYTLLRTPWNVRRLIVAHGYDVKLGDETRMAAIRASLEQVARATGASPVIVRTNLREHPAVGWENWPRTHGGPIAALGHVCRDAIGELLISSTKPYHADAPWGSHWKTDPGWSSARVRISHVGAERRRNDKLAAMLDEPLVQRHLRVCWENRAPTGNCGECEKCLRTMVVIESYGRLDEFPVFPNRTSLAARIDALPAAIPDVVPVYRTALARIRDRRLRTAVERLINRTLPSPPPSRLRRAVDRIRRSNR
jgi:hypothetical protein